MWAAFFLLITVCTPTAAAVQRRRRTLPTVSAPFGGVVQSPGRDPAIVTFVVVSNWTQEGNFATVMEEVCDAAGYKPVCENQGCTGGSPSGWNYGQFKIPWDVDPEGHFVNHPEPDGWCAIFDKFPPDFCLYDPSYTYNACIVGGKFMSEFMSETSGEMIYHKTAESGLPILCGKAELTTATPPECTSGPPPPPPDPPASGPESVNDVVESPPPPPYTFAEVLQIGDSIQKVSFALVSDWEHTSANFSVVGTSVCSARGMQPVCDIECALGLQIVTKNYFTNLFEMGGDQHNDYNNLSIFPTGWCGIQTKLAGKAFCTVLGRFAECVTTNGFFISGLPPVSGLPILCGRAENATANDLPDCATATPGPTPGPTTSTSQAPTPASTPASTPEPTPGQTTETDYPGTPGPTPGPPPTSSDPVHSDNPPKLPSASPSYAPCADECPTLHSPPPSTAGPCKLNRVANELQLVLLQTNVVHVGRCGI